ncbi:copper-sensing transcriptional repressor CsoR domain protein [Aneurinibacillus aneurinilyticus ATCC 12856]|jgi:DNA-binding FrmR family transcriptional regulator|uniref:Copper-sensing transcriptional repressor CsoR domain protein n=2 Tax=Aneurinibacillus aneurinilyticus TaxID=1391 RepID=U1WZX0_ANEAE|nr:copper-sensing transcriptional repressor CsoR domain protein [Aneurinibacillus aneurinilyticus ATCC 12856]
MVSFTYRNLTARWTGIKSAKGWQGGEMMEPGIEEQSGGGDKAQQGCERTSHHSDKMKNNLTTRLNRIEGQIRGIKGMVEKDVYCDDILNQIAAVQSALNSVGRLLLEGHMKSCVIERIQEGDHDVIDELLKTMNKLMK